MIGWMILNKIKFPLHIVIVELMKGNGRKIVRLKRSKLPFPRCKACSIKANNSKINKIKLLAKCF